MSDTLLTDVMEDGEYLQTKSRGKQTLVTVTGQPESETWMMKTVCRNYSQEYLYICLRGQRLSTGTSSKKGTSEMIKHMKQWLHYISYLKMATSVIWVNKKNNITRNNYCKQGMHIDSIYNY